MTAGFLDYARTLEDPRIEGMATYPLDEIFLVALVGVLCGGDDWEDVALCAEEKLDFLRGFLPCENGVPPEQTLRRFFRALDGAAFADVFTAWITGFTGSLSGVVAIKPAPAKSGGKTLRGSKRSADGTGALHLLPAFAHEAGLVIGQRAVDGKSNEISAIPRLPDVLSIEGAIVTMDAMGTQRQIAEKVLEKRADYVMALKGNQGTLHDDIRLFFEDPPPDTAFHTHRAQEAGHGRIETRECAATGDIGWLQDRHDWPGLKSVCAITATREDKKTGKTSTETRYYISSLPPDPEMLLQTVRAHWSVENNLHWQLDVTFRDDLCRSRKDHAALNFALIKHAALNILKQAAERMSLKKKRKKAGWNHDFLYKCLVNNL